MPNAITYQSADQPRLDLHVHGGRYYRPLQLVILCVLLDKADSSAARLLEATSAIGVQLDSFSDFVHLRHRPRDLGLHGPLAGSQ